MYPLIAVNKRLICRRTVDCRLCGCGTLCLYGFDRLNGLNGLNGFFFFGLYFLRFLGLLGFKLFFFCLTFGFLCRAASGFFRRKLLRGKSLFFYFFSELGIFKFGQLFKYVGNFLFRRSDFFCKLRYGAA